MDQTETPGHVDVLIVDDDLAARQVPRRRLRAPGLRVVAEVSDAAEAVRMTLATGADVVLMDLRVPGDALAAIRSLTAPRAAQPVGVIVRTGEGGHDLALAAIRAGATGCLLTSDDDRLAVGAVRAVARGVGFLSPGMTRFVLQEVARIGGTPPGGAADTGLTRAEVAVIGHLCAGRTSNEEIAAALAVSVNTVRSQLSSALRKLALADRTQLALWGVRHGLDLDPIADRSVHSG